MKRRKKNNNILIIIAMVLGIVIIVILILLLTSLSKKNDNISFKKPTSTVQTTAPDEQKTEEQSKNNTEESTEIQTETQTEIQIETQTETKTEAATEQQTEQTLPEKTDGKWDLSLLPNKETPYGNDREQVTDAGIPTGVFWYGNKWGKYNAEFISEMGIKYNKGETTDKIVYLTMDCGFDNEHTGPILDILKEKNVKATFFVTSMFYDARPDLIKRMIDEGHRIGSHSINHKNMTTLSVEEQEKEIMDVVNKLKADYNYDCKLFRFPEGLFSDRCLAVVDNLGLKSVFWSYAYNDYSSNQPEVGPSYDAAVKYLHPGAIYLLHASSSTNSAFLGDWIDAARAAGYEFGGVYPVD